MNSIVHLRLEFRGRFFCPSMLSSAAEFILWPDTILCVISSLTHFHQSIGATNVLSDVLILRMQDGLERHESADATVARGGGGSEAADESKK